MNKFMEFLQNKLAPIGQKLAGQKHIQAVSNGVMCIIPLTLIGAIFQIISTPPLKAEMAANTGIFEGFFLGWISFAAEWGSALRVPYNMTMNMMGLIVAFTIAYNLAKTEKLNPLFNGLVSMIIFLMVAAPVTTGYLGTAVTAGVLNTGAAATSIMASGFLGSQGLFAAMAIGLVSVSLTSWIEKKGLKLNLPDSIPPNIAQPFNAIIPLLMNIIVIFGLNVLLMRTTQFNLITGLMKILTPGLNSVNTPIGMSILMGFAMLLWFFGIHGTAIVAGLIVPIGMAAATTNAALLASGGIPVFQPVSTFGYALIGGSGATLGLTIMMTRSKSAQLKTIGKIGIMPGFMGINEPVIFGTPILLNAIMLIPFILAPVVIVLLTCLAGSLGIIRGETVYMSALLPVGVLQGIRGVSIMNFLWAWLMIPVSALIYYPFFKVQEKNLLKMEMETESSDDVAAAV